MFCPSHIKNYIITGLVSNFFMHLVTGWHILCRKEITISSLLLLVISAKVVEHFISARIIGHPLNEVTIEFKIYLYCSFQLQISSKKHYNGNTRHNKLILKKLYTLRKKNQKKKKKKKTEKKTRKNYNKMAKYSFLYFYALLLSPSPSILSLSLSLSHSFF